MKSKWINKIKLTALLMSIFTITACSASKTSAISQSSTSEVKNKTSITGNDLQTKNKSTDFKTTNTETTITTTTATASLTPEEKKIVELIEKVNAKMEEKSVINYVGHVAGLHGAHPTGEDARSLNYNKNLGYFEDYIEDISKEKSSFEISKNLVKDGFIYRLDEETKEFKKEKGSFPTYKIKNLNPKLFTLIEGNEEYRIESKEKISYSEVKNLLPLVHYKDKRENEKICKVRIVVNKNFEVKEDFVYVDHKENITRVFFNIYDYKNTKEKEVPKELIEYSNNK